VPRGQEILIDCCTARLQQAPGAKQQRRGSSKAVSSKRQQCHVYSGAAIEG